MSTTHTPSAGESGSVSEEHLNWSLRIAEEGDTIWARADQAAARDRLEREHDNLRAALRWALATGRADAALRICGAVWFFWYVRGYMSEGRAFIEQTLAATSEPPAARIKALQGLTVLALNLGDGAGAEAAGRESIELSRSAEDPGAYVLSLNLAGLVARHGGEFSRATDLHTEAIGHARNIGDEIQLAMGQCFLGLVEWFSGNPTASRDLLEAALVTFLAPGPPWFTGLCLAFLGLGDVADNRLERATARLDESVGLCRQLHDFNLVGALP